MVTFKEFFSFKGNRVFWLNLIAMAVVLAGAVYGTLVGLDIYTHHGESFVVPDVKNKQWAQAAILLRDKHMQGVIIDSTYVKGLPSGIVIDQTPAGGARVKEGRTVYLTVNTSRVPLVKIPDIIDNSSMRQAAAKLKSMGFRLTEPELISGEQDWVYGIKYIGRELQVGDEVPREALLTLCVGDTHVRDSLAIDSLNLQLDAPEGEKAKVDDSWF